MKSFPNPAKFEIRPNFGRSRISAGFVKKAGFRQEPELEPNSGSALDPTADKMKQKGRISSTSHHFAAYFAKSHR